MQNFIIEKAKNKNISFYFSFTIYVIGLSVYLMTMTPYIENLLAQKLPKGFLSNISNLHYLIAFITLFMLTFSLFVEGFILFIIAFILGSEMNFKNFIKYFTFSNIPIAIEYILIAIKNIFFNTQTAYLFVDNWLFDALDIFNILYLFLLFLFLKYRSDFNTTALYVFICISFIIRIFY